MFLYVYLMAKGLKASTTMIQPSQLGTYSGFELFKQAKYEFCKKIRIFQIWTPFIQSKIWPIIQSIHTMYPEGRLAVGGRGTKRSSSRTEYPHSAGESFTQLCFCFEKAVMCLYERTHKPETHFVHLY